MRLIFYSISKFIQFIRSSLYCARCLCCHDNALAAFVTLAKEQQNCCCCSLKSSKYANEINIPSEYELTDGKNLLVNNDNSNSKETKLNLRNLSHKKKIVNGSAPKFEEKSCFYFVKSLSISAIAKFFYVKCKKKTEFLLIYFALFGVLK